MPWRVGGSSALAVGGWWYARNACSTATRLGLGVHLNTPWARPAQISLAEVLSTLPLVYRSFWGAFGWGNVEMSPIIYYAHCRCASSFADRLDSSTFRARPLTATAAFPALLMGGLCGVAQFLSRSCAGTSKSKRRMGDCYFLCLARWPCCSSPDLARLPRPRMVLGVVASGILFAFAGCAVCVHSPGLCAT